MSEEKKEWTSQKEGKGKATAVVAINETTKNFVIAVNNMVGKGKPRRMIGAELGLNETAFNLILSGSRNLPPKYVPVFERLYLTKITPGQDNADVLKDLAVKALAVGEANRKATAAIYAAVLKMPPETAAEILESLYREELEKLRSEMLQA